MYEVKGAEGIVLHNNNVILGMQKQKRWYNLENKTRGAIIKTLGGEIENEDLNSSKKALIREITEEINDITIANLKIDNKPLFTKKIVMGDLNYYQKDSKLSMTADFYLVEIINKDKIFPNDLPAIIEIPIKEFLKLDFCKEYNIEVIEKYIIKSLELPEYFSLMIPEEVKSFLKKYLKIK